MTVQLFSISEATRLYAISPMHGRYDVVVTWWVGVTYVRQLTWHRTAMRQSVSIDTAYMKSCIQPHFCPDKCVGVGTSACYWQLQAGMSKMFCNDGMNLVNLNDRKDLFCMTSYLLGRALLSFLLYWHLGLLLLLHFTDFHACIDRYIGMWLWWRE